MATQAYKFSLEEFGDALVYFLQGVLYKAYKITHASIKLTDEIIVEARMKEGEYAKAKKPQAVIENGLVYYLTHDDIKHAFLEYMLFMTVSHSEKFVVGEILTEIPKKIAVEIGLSNPIGDESREPRQHVFDGILKL
jgi:hypothetical protein